MFQLSLWFCVVFGFWSDFFWLVWFSIFVFCFGGAGGFVCVCFVCLFFIFLIKRGREVLSISSFGFNVNTQNLSALLPGSACKGALACSQRSFTITKTWEYKLLCRARSVLSMKKLMSAENKLGRGRKDSRMLLTQVKAIWHQS